MGFKIEILVKNALEVMFGLGLLGCALTVVISWVSVGRAALSPDDDDSE